MNAGAGVVGVEELGPDAPVRLHPEESVGDPLVDRERGGGEAAVGAGRGEHESVLPLQVARVVPALGVAPERAEAQAAGDRRVHVDDERQSTHALDEHDLRGDGGDHVGRTGPGPGRRLGERGGGSVGRDRLDLGEGLVRVHREQRVEGQRL